MIALIAAKVVAVVFTGWLLACNSQTGTSTPNDAAVNVADAGPGGDCRRAAAMDPQCKDPSQSRAYACAIPYEPPLCTRLGVGSATNWYCCP